MTAEATPPTLEDAPPARRWSLVAAIATSAIALLFIAGIFGVRWYAAHRVRTEAQKLGFEVDFDGFELRFGRIALIDASVALAGVPGVRGTAKRVDVALDGFAPTRVDAEGLAFTLEGNVPVRLAALRRWSRAHKETFALPGSARNVSVAWSEKSGRTPWVTLGKGTLTSRNEAPRSLELVAKTASVLGIAAGPALLRWPADLGKIAIALGSESVEKATVLAELVSSGDSTTGTIEVKPTAIPKSFARAGGPTGTASATLAFKLTESGAASGTAQAAIDGWIPPRVKEWSRVVHGNKTTVKTAFRAKAGSRVTLEDTEVSVGSLKLKGKGSVDPVGDHATVRLDLAGAIPCSEAARAMASDLLGDVFGAIASGAAQGSVAIRVQIEADTRDLGRAKVEPAVKPNCKLGL